MSGRKGLGVKIDDLVELLLERSRGEIASRRPEAGEKGEEDARAIAVGALRYFLLKFGKNKLIAFDFDEALNFEGDTGPYLQYSLVRADNIFRKLEERGLAETEEKSSDSADGWDDGKREGQTRGTRGRPGGSDARNAEVCTGRGKERQRSGQMSQE